MAVMRQVSGNSKYINYALTWGEKNHWESCAYPSTNANNECATATYCDLFELTGNSTYIASARQVLWGQVTANSTEDWSWVDAVFMALPSFVRMGKATGLDAFYEQGRLEFEQTAVGKYSLWSADHGLFWRDDTYVNSSSPNGAPVFWARGNGWAFAALARSIGLLPANRTDDRARYTSIFTAMAASLAKVQGSDGMWRSNLLDAGQFSNPETTGTSLYTFGMAWGVNNGVLDAATYTPIVNKAWQGLTQIAVQSSGYLGWCQPAAGSPGPATAADWSDFCVGQFLLAGSEVFKLAAR